MIKKGGVQMKKIISSILIGALAFNTVTFYDAATSQSPKVAQAKSTKKLFDEGENKVMKYIYAKKPAYKKKKILVTEKTKERNGDLIFGVHEDPPKSPTMIRVGLYKLTKKSGYKNLYELDMFTGNYKLVKKFKK